MKKIYNEFSRIFTETCRGIVGIVKGQIILMCVTYIILCTGLVIIEAPLPYLIALGITVFDILPVAGSGMIMIPWAVISLIAGNKDMALGVAVVYLVLTVSRQVLEPIIIGKKIGIRPLYTFAASILGSILFGPLGFLIGPAAAIVISSVCKTKKTG